jgi:sigma-B regulation protein RsbU (phosphoserine phosphatase)
MPDGHFLEGPQVDLEPGDLVFLYTDGVIEGISPDETLFGIERALQVLRNNLARSASEMVEALYQAVSAFIGRPVLEDDVTAIVIKVA